MKSLINCILNGIDEFAFVVRLKLTEPETGMLYFQRFQQCSQSVKGNSSIMFRFPDTGKVQVRPLDDENLDSGQFGWFVE
jgi:hypothetical protein